MANPQRGEIEAVLGGKTYTLCLTLGALAELEAAFGADDMLALTERFETGRLKARDAILILAAGLRGGGNAFSDEEVAALGCERGIAGCIETVAKLLQATFSTGAESGENGS